jgi:hypothetical protein
LRQHRPLKLSKNHDASSRHLLRGGVSHVLLEHLFRRGEFHVIRGACREGPLTRMCRLENATLA